MLWFGLDKLYLYIRTWNELITIFKNQCRVNKDHVHFLTEFEELKRNPSEPVAIFIKRFNKLYHKMRVDCKPPIIIAKVRFSKAFEDEFVVMLRERVSNTLDDMHTNFIEVEANRFASIKLKTKVEKVERKLKARLMTHLLPNLNLKIRKLMKLHL